MESESAEAESVWRFLSAAPERWLDVGSPQGSPQIREILQWHAMYCALTDNLPNLVLTSSLMTTIVEESGIGGGFLSCSEMSRSGWFGGTEDARAAAIFGRDGHLEAVLVACTFLAQGFDIYGGAGRPLVDGYRFLLPAVASYFAADSDVDLADAGIPRGWWDAAGTGPMPIQPNAPTYALNPRLDKARQREVIGRGPGDGRYLLVELFGGRIPGEVRDDPVDVWPQDLLRLDDPSALGGFDRARIHTPVGSRCMAAATHALITWLSMSLAAAHGATDLVRLADRRLA